jgi:rhomboid protease GluP
MPKQKKTIALSNLDKETALAISYQAFKDLGWSVLYAGDEKLLGQSIKKWSNNSQEIVVASSGNELTVSSEMTKGELFDIAGKNKKNIAVFLAAFETAKNNLQADTIETNRNAVNELRSTTATAAVQEQKDATEADKAMNLSGSNLYVTYAIIGINVLVFILMAINGAGIFETNALVHIKWGSNYSPLTLTGDWWRLISNIFIHFGIIHIAMNMYCLYSVGIYLEPMLGKVKYITAYLCTGILASIVSLWWHKEGVNSAGASGAIFGMYGLFLALLTSDLIPKKVRQALLQSIGIFVVYNLVYGVKSGVDNAAHVGGLLSGFAFGYLYIISIKKEKQNEKVQWLLPVILLITAGTAAGYLGKNKETAEKRTAALNQVKDAGYKDTERYNERLNEIVALEGKAVGPLSDTALTNFELKTKIETICLPSWTEADEKLKQMKGYTVSQGMQVKVDKLQEYVQLRKEELAILLKMIDTGNQDELMPEHNAVINKINAISEELGKL